MIRGTPRGARRNRVGSGGTRSRPARATFRDCSRTPKVPRASGGHCGEPVKKPSSHRRDIPGKLKAKGRIGGGGSRSGRDAASSDGKSGPGNDRAPKPVSGGAHRIDGGPDRRGDRGPRTASGGESRA